MARTATTPARFMAQNSKGPSGSDCDLAGAERQGGFPEPQQDRWSNGGAHGLVAGITHNGGTTWTETFAHFSECAGGTAANGGDFERSSDPWVTFAPNGDAYQFVLQL
jgi:hypothetical protein